MMNALSFFQATAEIHCARVIFDVLIVIDSLSDFAFALHDFEYSLCQQEILSSEVLFGHCMLKWSINGEKDAMIHTYREEHTLFRDDFPVGASGTSMSNKASWRIIVNAFTHVFDTLLVNFIGFLDLKRHGLLVVRFGQGCSTFSSVPQTCSHRTVHSSEEPS